MPGKWESVVTAPEWEAVVAATDRWHDPTLRDR
jgi:hypothetical protein